MVLSPIEILVEIICGHDNYRYSGTKSEETEGENERKEDSSQKTDIKSIIQTKCPEFKSMAVVWKELSTGYLAYDAENEKIQDVFLNFYHSVKEAFLLFTDDNAHITGIDGSVLRDIFFSIPCTDFAMYVTVFIYILLDNYEAILFFVPLSL